jgi:enamine deaminase RidA (YjgF/YER057c/UK114 family)
MRILIPLLFACFIVPLSSSADVTRYPLPDNSTFPIAQAVEVSSGSLVFLSGLTPQAANPQAQRGTPAFYGNTETQTVSVLNRMQEALEDKGLSMSDVVKLTVFLVGDPAQNNAMDFSGFMAGYTQFFGTEEQPNLPARSAFQIAGLTSPLMFVEIEAIAVRDGPGGPEGSQRTGSRLRDSENLLDFLGF